mmetsp:Transcript_17865/g.53787  ORF Transcript_17865/g.53787 Transcript_17865/m.53787 type:complete len:155 (-) Transcript_17865:1474-1938(-)
MDMVVGSFPHRMFRRDADAKANIWAEQKRLRHAHGLRRQSESDLPARLLVGKQRGHPTYESQLQRLSPKYLESGCPWVCWDLMAAAASLCTARQNTPRGKNPKLSSICTPSSSMPSKMKVTTAAAGAVAHPIVGHSAAGSVTSHSIMHLLVWRV